LKEVGKSETEIRETAEEGPEGARYQIRLPGFITDEEIGLGEVIKRATSAVGIPPCGGCAARAALLNRWMVFMPRRRR
jgi:hypothetical protein